MSAKLKLFEIIVGYSEAEALEALAKLAASSEPDAEPLESSAMDLPRADAGASKRLARAERITKAGNRSTGFTQ